MDETDEKLMEVYRTLERAEARIMGEISKAESRMGGAVTDKLNSLKDLVNASTTARHETVATEIERLQKGTTECSGRCANTVRGFDNRLQSLERFRVTVSRFMNTPVIPVDISGLTNDVNELKSWKSLNWQRTIVYAAVSIVAALKALDWLGSLLSKAAGN